MRARTSVARPIRGVHASAPLRLLAVANWDLERYPTPWAAQRLGALAAAGVDVELLSEDCVDDRGGFLRLWRRLGLRLERGDVDVVAPLYGSMLGFLCAAQRRVPCALSFSGTDLNGVGLDTLRGLRLAPSMLLSQLTVPLAATVSVRSRKMHDRIWWGPRRTAAWIIPSGVDVSHFRPRPRAEARVRLRRPTDGTRVGFVVLGASRRPEKRLELARAAVARLPGATLDVLEGHPFADMPWAYASVDAVVLTSRREGSPNCVKEALACGVPVIAVDVGDVGEVLEGLTNCAVVEAAPAALARGLAAALRDGRGCPEGPARMAARYSLEAMARHFVDFYLEARDRDRGASLRRAGA